MNSDNKYIFLKRNVDIKNVRSIEICFTNGDFVEISQNEIVSIAVDYYDRLVMINNCFYPVAHSGLIKFRLSNSAPKYDHSFVCESEELNASRKQYVENRCVNEGGIRFIRLIDENNWDCTFCVDVVARTDGENLLLEIAENKTYGSYGSEYHYVTARNLTKSIIRKIRLDFENCESFDVYNNEITDLQINFAKELEMDGRGLVRCVQNGFIRMQPDKSIDCRPNTGMFSELEVTPQYIRKRLCGKDKRKTDICNLYVTYGCACREVGYEECVTLKDMRTEEELDKLYAKDDYYYYEFVSGYAKREDNGSILIVFGKNLRSKIKH